MLAGGKTGDLLHFDTRRGRFSLSLEVRSLMKPSSHCSTLNPEQARINFTRAL